MNSASRSTNVDDSFRNIASSGKKLKQLLATGEPVWGASLPEASNLMASMTCDAGVDFLWIETEHVPYGAESIAMMPVLCRLKGCAPLVRVAGLDSTLIKKALDIGASGIVIPQIETAEEARLAVKFCKYPPEGTRGISPMWTFHVGVSWTDYLPLANSESCVILQIESVAGMRNLEAIADTEGVDVLLIGPMDLSASVGQIGKTDHPEMRKLIAEFPPRIAKTGKVSGFPAASLETAQAAFQQGYRFINVGHLLLHGSLGLTAIIQELRNVCKTKTAADPGGIGLGRT